MKLKDKIKIIRSDFLYKTLFVSVFSTFITLIFAVYNAYLGLKYRDSFATGISIYYLLLVIIKFSTIIIEKKILLKAEEEKINIRHKNYIISSCLIFFIDVCLIAPIIIRVINPSNVNFGIIPAITMACYSTYKIIFAILNYKRSINSQNPTTILIRTINVIDASVSILTLQHTLIMVNDGMSYEMRILSLITSITFIIVIIIFSIISFIRNKNLFNQQKHCSKN